MGDIIFELHDILVNLKDSQSSSSANAFALVDVLYRYAMTTVYYIHLR